MLLKTKSSEHHNLHIFSIQKQNEKKGCENEMEIPKHILDQVTDCNVLGTHGKKHNTIYFLFFKFSSFITIRDASFFATCVSKPYYANSERNFAAPRKKRQHSLRISQLESIRNRRTIFYKKLLSVKF